MNEDQDQKTEPRMHEVWCFAEFFGHKRTAGRISEVMLAGIGMLRLEVPNVDGPGFTADLYNPKAIYRLRPCTEAEARAAVKAFGDAPPVQPYELLALTAGSERRGRDPNVGDDEEY